MKFLPELFLNHFCDKPKFMTKPIFVFGLISILKTKSFAANSLRFSWFNAASLSEWLCTNVGDKKSTDNSHCLLKSKYVFETTYPILNMK